MPSFSVIDRAGQPQAGEGALDLSGARLLVVDDEESVALTVSEVLRQEGFKVDTSSSGDEAVARLSEGDYDLVLTDLHMEGGDGLSVLAEIRRRAPLTISIVLTGFASVESAIAALRQGAYDYLVKPCIIDDLKYTVRRGVEHRRLMLAEREARTELEHLNRDLERRVEERTAELTRLNQKLAEANRAKDIFLATLSHELRTPLTPVLGWVNLLRTSNMDALMMTQALDAIERNARLQARLIDDLLDISRIVSGKLQLEQEPADLNAVVEAAIETVRSSAAARRITLGFELADEPLIVTGSPVRLQQIVWNLLSNGIKFTEAGGRVHVRVESDSREARVIVEDTGIGIAPEFLPQVFDRFRQADGTTTRQHGGLGLGLAIVDALAKLHRGRVLAESNGIGHGARFTFTMPRAEPVRQATEVEAYIDTSNLPQPVLVVEDSPDTLSLLHMLFTKKGCRVMTADSAPQALQLASQETPGIIISDIGLPEMDGYELLARLRSMPGLEKVPAIALSGYAMGEDRDRALAAGFIAHVPKPIDPEELFALVQKISLESGV
ncbi:MAG TPA: response regulator [Pyrinomonadaceae bacterium]|jgi:signal transduction histidine kinase